MAAIALVNDGDEILASQQNAIANALNGPWSDWTPAIIGSSASPVLGSGSNAVGRYKVQADGLVVATGLIEWGTSSSNGSGNYEFSLPANANVDELWDIGSANFRDTGTETYVGTCTLLNTAKFMVQIHGQGSLAFAGSSGPIATFANGDSIRFHVVYEPA